MANDRQIAIANTQGLLLDAMAVRDEAKEDLVRVQATVDRSERLVSEALNLLASLQRMI